jgi:hypothetical protein
MGRQRVRISYRAIEAVAKVIAGSPYFPMPNEGLLLGSSTNHAEMTVCAHGGRSVIAWLMGHRHAATRVCFGESVWFGAERAEKGFGLTWFCSYAMGATKTVERHFSC